MTSSSLAGWAGAFALLVAGACTYDFEVPFSETPVGGGAGGAGGAGGSAAGGTGGGDGGTTSGTGGQSGGEQCGNGTDDDGDDLIDCADPDCSEFTCVEPPPEGWTLGAFAVVSEGEPLPDCGTGWPTSTEANAGLVSDPAQCDCSCSSPTVTCSLATTRYTDSTSCQWAQLAVLTPSANGACDPLQWINGADTSDGLEGEAVAVQSASCDATEGTHTLPAVTWTERGRICGGSSLGGGCGGSQLCAPPTPAPFSLCISQDGDQECPAPYTAKRLRYDGANESRSCDCSCGAPANAACTASTEVWPWSANCQGSPSTTVANDGSCVIFEGPPSNGSFQYTATPSGDPCPASGQPTGEATPSEPLTVCCLP
ncbi:MAG: hypothetical protein JRI68_04755 [Deltaproteobacteria bacterium]|nr:hypothetical protein [Deltaproteobacteria bacterium]